MCTYVCMYISCEEFFYFLGDECFHIAFVLLDWVIRRSDNELRFLVFLFYSCIPDYQNYLCLTPWGHECSALPQCAEWAPALHSNLLGELGKGFAFACCPAISCSWGGVFFVSFDACRWEYPVLMGERAVVTVMWVLGKAEAAGAMWPPLIYPSCSLLRDRESCCVCPTLGLWKCTQCMLVWSAAAGTGVRAGGAPELWCLCSSPGISLLLCSDSWK